jgi:hypothetical protein
MSKKLTCGLFVAFNLLIAAALYVTISFTLPFGLEPDFDATLVSLLTTAAFLFLAYRALTTRILPTHPRSRDFVMSYANGLTKWLLVPIGLCIGGWMGREFLDTSPVAAALLTGWFIFPIAIPYLVSLIPTTVRYVPTDPDFVRGTYIMSIQEAWRRALRMRCPPDEPRICWGGVGLPERCSKYHFAIIGVTGSGKTLTLRMLMQSVLPRIEPGSGWRAFIYDPKNEFLPILDGMPLRCPMKTLHPYDARSVAWDIGRDVDSRSVASTLAATLIPDPGGQNSFFYKASQAILSAVMEAFILLAPQRWTLRDVLLLVSDIEATKRVLKGIPQTRRAYQKYFLQRPDTLSDVLVTLATETEVLEPIAALWDRATEKVSLKDWASDSYILHITKDKEIEEPLDNVNRVIFQRIAQIFTKKGGGRTWIFIDEAKFAGKIPGLDDLLTTGRTFGARVCLCVQDVSGLQHVYGDKLAEEILGGTCTTARFATSNPATADYNARVMGKTERIERKKSKTRGTGSTHSWTSGSSTSTSESTTISEDRVIRDSVSPEQFMQLYPANDVRFYGFYTSLPIGRWAGWLRHAQALCPITDKPAFVPRDAKEQYLRPWNDNDRERLGPEFSRLLGKIEPDGDPKPPDHASHLDEVLPAG